MWHWVFPHIRPTLLNIPIVIGAILGIVGLVLWAVSGFSDRDALVCVILGVLIFLGFLKVKSIVTDYKATPPEE